MRPPALPTVVRHVPWRRLCVALAFVAIAMQQLAVVAAARMDPLATGAAWPEAAAVCHADGADTGDSPSTDESPARCAASCPLCLAVQQLGRAIVPGDLVVPAPHPRAGGFAKPAAGSVLVATIDRARLARGPPLSA